MAPFRNISPVMIFCNSYCFSLKEITLVLFAMTTFLGSKFIISEILTKVKFCRVFGGGMS